MVKIKAIENGSIAADLGIRTGDNILSINGENVRDILDYRFLIADEEIELAVDSAGQRVVYEIEKDHDDNLGIECEAIQIRFCGNDCPFCFVDQNPQGMRDAMYFRDEDFRLSFISGHYVTLTNLSKRDMDRIVRQRLSPIFVSVHATEPAVRRFLFGIAHDDQLLQKLAFLTGNGIELHTQIVLCPGINDGDILKQTIWDLAEFLPHLRSVSIVPVGLTKHREGLNALEPVTTEYAAELLQIADRYAQEFRQQTGEYFVYSSDEFYIMADQPLPPAGRYDGFYQKENGVGMVRHLLDDFDEQRKHFPDNIVQPSTATFVTGTLAYGFMEETIIPALAQVDGFQPRLAVIENDFYGKSIRVTGLLTGQDIYRQLKDKPRGDKVYIPGNCLKDSVIFLDDWTVKKLSDKLHCSVEPLDYDFLPVFEGLT
jgi:putative radical SAM enzyme (TIGR03279 family)